MPRSNQRDGAIMAAYGRGANVGALSAVIPHWLGIQCAAAAR